MPKKVQFNDKPYVKEDYKGLQLIGTPEGNCEVSDDVFDATKGILRPYMVPMFKGEPYNVVGASNYQGKLELYTGDVKKMLDRPQKKENVPLFKPFKEDYLLNQNDVFNRASAEESTRAYNNSFLSARPFEFPVEPVFVKKGLGLGYTAEGDPNPFHSQWRPPVKTVDELRGWVRPTFAFSRANAGVSEYVLGHNPITNPVRSKTRRQDAVYGLSIKDTIIPGIFKGDFGTPCNPEIIEKENKKMVFKSGTNLYKNADAQLGQENFELVEKNNKKMVFKSGTNLYKNADAQLTQENFELVEKDKKRMVLKGKTTAPFMNLDDANAEGRYDVEIRERRAPVLKGSNGQLKPLYYKSYAQTEGKYTGNGKKENVQQDFQANIENNQGFIQKVLGFLTGRETKTQVRTNNEVQIEVPTSIIDQSGKHVDVQLKYRKEQGNVRNEKPVMTGMTASAEDRAKHRERAEKLRLEAIRMSGMLNKEFGVAMPRGDMKDVEFNNKRNVMCYRNPDLGPRVQGHVKTDPMVPLNKIAPDADTQIFPPLTAPQLAGFNNQVILGENTKKNRRILYGERIEPDVFSSFGR